MANRQVLAVLIPGQLERPVLTSFEHFRQLNGSSLVFAFIGSYLMLYGTFSATLTTGAFDPSRLRWFATCPCRPVARGHVVIANYFSHLLCRLLRRTQIRRPDVIGPFDLQAGQQVGVDRR